MANIYLEGLVSVLSYPNVVLLFIAILLGLVVGAIPGLGGAVGVTVLLPITITMEPTVAIIFLMGIYAGAQYGGCIPAILINTPGTVGSAATTLDGYPMSKDNKAKTAITISAISSSVGNLISSSILLLIFPVIIAVLLLFQTPHYFLVAMIGLSLIAIVSEGSMVKGLLIGFFGILISTVGFAPVTSELRYTFGILELFDGISFVAVLLGVFAIAEMINLVEEPGRIQGEGEVQGSIVDGVGKTLRNWTVLTKSSVIGLLVGMIPGTGAVIASFVSYAEDIRTSSDPNSYGNGNPRGVIASEAGNNATVSGALIPTLAFGIPGSGTTAIVLGALLLQGLSPGTGLFRENAHITITILIALMVASLIILFLGVFFMSQFSRIVRINIHYIVPIVVVLSVIGTYSVRNNWIDILTIILFGFFGYYMYKYDYSVIALVLGVILGPIVEENFRRSLILSGGSLDIFVATPLGIVLVVILIFVLSYPITSEYGSRIRAIFAE